MSQPKIPAWIRFLGLVALIATLLFIRRSGGFMYPTLYYEDGTVFYADQLISGSALTVFQPFYHSTLGHGYYLLIPRITAFIAYLLPASVAPILFNGVGISCMAFATALFSLKRFRPLIKNDLLRVVLCLLAAISLDSTEWLANTTNTFWVTGIVAILLTAVPPKSHPSRGYNCVLAIAGFALALTTMLSAIAVPIVCWQLYRELRIKKTAANPFLIGFLLGAGIQLTLGSELLSPSPLISTSPKLHSPTAGVTGYFEATLLALTFRVILSSLWGYTPAQLINGDHGYLLLCLCLISFSALIEYLWWSAEKLKLIAALYFILIPVLLALYGRGLVSEFALQDLRVNWNGSRYYYISCCAFAFLWAVALERAAERLGFRGSSLPAATLSTVFALGVWHNFLLEDYNNQLGLSWESTASQIEQWKWAIAHDEPAPEVDAPIYREPWTIFLPANTIPNNDFEQSDAVSWKSSGKNPPSYTDSEAHSGKQSLRLAGKKGILTRSLYIKGNQRVQLTLHERAVCSGSLIDEKTKLPRSPTRSAKISFEVIDRQNPRSQRALGGKPMHLLECNSWIADIEQITAARARTVVVKIRWKNAIDPILIDDLRLDHDTGS